MPAPLNPHLKGAAVSPVPEALSWLEGRTFAADQPLLNLSQAAPSAPPPAPLREAIAKAVLHDADSHIYGPVLGDAPLRNRVAEDWSAAYGAEIVGADVAITAGANQAYVTALATLAGPGDAVMLPTPWYFNHKMAHDMAGIETIPLPCGDDLTPDVDQARALLTDRVKAIALVTPNNPTGVEYPDGLLNAFYDLAKDAGLGLILDETYLDFRKAEGAPHTLFQRPDWRDHLCHLYSFSKTYRLTGHRVGALICGEARLAQAEKYLDTTTICANRLAQHAALFGLCHLSGWVAAERAEYAARRAVVTNEFETACPGWRLLGCGAFFAYVAHPFEHPARTVAKALLTQKAILTLPGDMFTLPGDPMGDRTLRLAFANTDGPGVRAAFARMASVA